MKKSYEHIYHRFFPQCIPTRFLICLMMFTACWTSYMCRLQMPILVVPMTSSKNEAGKSGYCDTNRDRRAIWYDIENIYDHMTFQDDASEEIEEKNSLRSNDMNKMYDLREFRESSVDTDFSKRTELREKRDAETDSEFRSAGDGVTFFSGKPFEWDASIQAQLLASYGYGNAPGNFVGGILAIKWGPRRSILWTSLIAAILSIISPFLAQVHWSALCISRMVIGFAGGVTFPACHTLVAKWAPPEEKGRFIWSLLGGTFGTIITYPMIAAIAESVNWETAWYFPSLMMFLWILFWILLVYDSPAEHPGITEEEKEMIINAQSGTVTKKKPTLAQTPIRKILTSVPFISLVVLHFGNLFLLFFYQNSMTQYLSRVLGFKLTKGGALASLPWAGRMFFGFIFSWIADYFKKREILKITLLRKYATIFSHLVPGLFLIAVSYVGCNFLLANVFLVLSLGFNGAATIANLSNNQDLSPNFAGFLYGIMNTVGSTSGFIGPPIVAAITSGEDSIENWQIVFWVGAAVCIISMIIFCIGGSGEIQSWNTLVESDESNESADAEGGTPETPIPDNEQKT